MRIAITGSGGRVGRALARRLAARHEVIELPRERLDLARAESVAAIDALDFEVLLHPAAMTSIEACEAAPEEARRVNGEAPARLAACCRRRGRRMLHFSTDYVLDGREPGLKDESAALDPLSVYAETKARAEAAVREQEQAVLRVSWVFGPERPAFPDAVLERALAGEPLEAIADKTSLPVFTGDLVGWVEALLEAGLPGGIWHGCQGGEPTSWHGLAEAVVGQLHRLGRLPSRPPVAALELASMKAFRAPRPRHTEMATARLGGLLGRPPRDWREALDEHVAARLNR